MSNFDFLKGFDDPLWKCGNRIEEQINKYPFGVHSEATAFLEHILKKLRESEGLKPSKKPFYYRLEDVHQSNRKKVPFKYKNDIYNAYLDRNKIHADLEDIEKNQYVIALRLHKKLYYIAKKYFEIFGGEADEIKGFPPYKAPELDFSPDEIDLIEISIDDVEFKHDECVVCGKSNHSNYSIYCEDCNREIEYFNNYITIRNSFGKDYEFNRETLIDYGIPEGYVSNLLNFLVKNKLLMAKGIKYTFNNSNLESYRKKIDNYLKVGELITKFWENKITPAEIKQTNEYEQGSFNHKDFRQFYKIINEEIINKFENELIRTENINDAIEYSTITPKELNNWYNNQLKNFNKNNSDESFEIFNKLLIDEYLTLKRQGVKNADIFNQLNITKEMFEFFPIFKGDFTDEINQIKKDLIIKALNENKSEDEAIECAEITRKEYENMIELSKFKDDDFFKQREKEINSRKEQVLINLTDYDLLTSCKKSNINIDVFYEWYDEAKIDSQFYIKSTEKLMKHFLDERRLGKTKHDACKSIHLKENIVDYWLKRNDKLFDKFQNDNIKVVIDLILKGFKNQKTRKEISEFVEISVDKINYYLRIGKKGSSLCNELSTYYENEVIPKQLNRFLVEIKNKTLKKSLQLVDLTNDELNHYYEDNPDFHDKFLSIKIDRYVDEFVDGRNHKTSLKRSNLSEKEYIQLKDEIDAIILNKKMKLVKKEILNNKTTEVAAKNAKVTFDDIYGWYYKGKSDENYKEFSEFFYSHYIEPNVLHFNDLLSNGHPVDKILKVFDINFTQKDFEIWQNDGLINKEDVIFDLNRGKKDKKEKSSILESHTSNIYKTEGNFIKKDGYNSKLYQLLNDDEDDEEVSAKEFISQKNPTKRSSILKHEDNEKLKKEMGIEDNE